MLDYALALLADVLAVGIIPWLVAGLRKKPMTPKGYRGLSIVFAILGPGRMFASMGSDLLRVIVIMDCVICFFTTYYVGTTILKRRGKLAGSVTGDLRDD
nr:MAG TPA: hypothetical protein [Caudoviricetes sp.]